MHPYLAPSLNFGPLVMQRMIKAMAASQYDERAAPDRFTPREAIAHLADWEPILLERIKLCVEQPGATCVVYDEGERAAQNQYDRTDIFEEANRFRDARARTTEYVMSLTKDDLAKTTIHPERGPLTTEDVVGMLLGHDMYHVEHLSQYLSERVVPTF